MKQVLVNVETLEKTARLAEAAVENDTKLQALLSEREKFASKAVPEIVDTMIKQGVLAASQREKAASQLAAGDYNNIANTMLFLINKIGAPSMGAPETSTKVASVGTSDEKRHGSYDEFARKILG